MYLFRNKIEKILPVMDKYYVAGQNGVVKQYFSLRNNLNTFNEKIHIPYISDSIKYLQNCGGRVNRRLLLVADSENVAVKSAAYIKANIHEYTDELYDEYDDDFDYYFEDDETEDYKEKIRVIDFNIDKNEEMSMTNKYLRFISDVTEDEAVLFKGLFNRDDIKDKLEVIGACPANLVFVNIQPEQLAEPWVQMLQMDLDCDVIRLSSYTNKYCVEILDYLLKGENYTLPVNVSHERLIQMIRKRRGRQFREEDIAWFLDKKSKSLIDYEKSPMEQLNNMTGLNNVKRAARELSALAREELVNEKLGVLHKNMIFVGNPGTGKTTSAKLLADIMAEEGNTNTSFVIAERKSLIGKYVGHTAHNVAGKFEEARGGVLFVDEAGFFLNEESGGYVEEAMKEFVRYMEIYPDVTVIFAMYSDEVEQFLKLDSGLSSRISRFVKFEDYTIDELTDITVKILADKGYSVDKAAVEVIYESLMKIRNDKKKQFGNAREARNLAESAIIAASIRRYKEKGKKNIILANDVEEGYSRLCTESDNKKSVFGFQTDIYVNKKMSTY